jgi:hypothetical protein
VDGEGEGGGPGMWARGGGAAEEGAVTVQSGWKCERILGHLI